MDGGQDIPDLGLVAACVIGVNFTECVHASACCEFFHQLVHVIVQVTRVDCQEVVPTSGDFGEADFVDEAVQVVDEGAAAVDLLLGTDDRKYSVP